ncbi:restriction endonuclease subunit S [Methanothrix sp.]|uniref:restriction endonuclease subunit S n=1 Tax=Methanothrix sp. TaxID=90426 RepID=UPI0032AED753
MEFISTQYGDFSADLNRARLHEVCVAKDGIITGPFGSQLHKKDYVELGTPMITVEHLGDNKIIKHNMPRIKSEDIDRLSRYILRTGDIVFSRVGSVDRRTLIGSSEDGWLFSGSCLRIRPDQQKIDPRFLSCFLGLPKFKEYIRKIAVGATRPSLNTSILNELNIYFPKIDEQRKIAAILSSVDAAIEQTDAIIAQTERMKKGLMQNLLTGKQRLPMFGDNWKMVAFEQVASIRREKINPKVVGELPFCIELEHIEQSSGRLISSSKTSEQSSIKSVFHQGDVLFGKLRAYLRKYWLADRDGYCSTEIWPLIPNRRLIAPGFLFQLVMTDRFIDAASITYGTHMPRTDWDVVKGHQINLPSVPEQEAIVAILSSIDKKLDEEKKYRDHLETLKNGLMQDLLTGRVRVKVDGNV